MDKINQKQKMKIAERWNSHEMNKIGYYCEGTTTLIVSSVSVVKLILINAALRTIINILRIWCRMLSLR